MVRDNFRLSQNLIEKAQLVISTSPHSNFQVHRQQQAAQ